MSLCARCQGIHFKPLTAPDAEDQPQQRDRSTSVASSRNLNPTSMDVLGSNSQSTTVRGRPHSSETGPGRPAPTPFVVYVLHETRESFNRSIAGKCRLCLLINSQLDQEELPAPQSTGLDAVDDTHRNGESNDASNILGDNFMVLKRQWPSFQGVRQSRPPRSNGVVTATSRNRGKSDEETLYFEELAKTAPVMVLSRRGPAILRVVKDLPEEHRVIYTKSDDTASGHARRARKRPFKDFMDGDSNISGAEPHSENTGSSSHMKLASLWLRNCLQNHDLCNTGVSSGHRLPRRLIDVSDPKRPFLVNVAALPNDRKATQYVALSYCWGEGERVMTETTNYEAHLKCIPAPHKTLPKTFVDAFKVTHELGFQYIWTDAFCMIQDSPGDKHDELPKMGDIYRYAVFTICAEGSPSSHAGLFQERQNISLRPCRISLTTTHADGRISAEVTLATKCVRTDFLEPRGWILQEEILACRRLLFGTQMSWRCVGSDASEVCPVPSPKTRVTGTLEGRTEDKLRMWLYEADSVKSRPAIAQGSRANHFDAWYSILEVYSLKELSFIGDVLAAVDGLANMFSQAHKVKYLAGVWQEDLQLGLAWFVSNNERRNVEPCGNKWPSWSWASVGKVAIRFRKWPRYGVAVEDVGAELINATCQASCVPPIAGKLVIRARVRAAFISSPGDTALQVAQQPVTSDRKSRQSSTPPEYRRVRFPAVLYEDKACDVALGTAALDRPLYGLDAGTDSVQPINVHSVVLALLHAQRTDGGEHAVYLVLGKKQDGSDYYVRRGVAFLNRIFSGLALETIVIV